MVCCASPSNWQTKSGLGLVQILARVESIT